MSVDNKLTVDFFDQPTHLPELILNLIMSSHGHSTPSLKISCKSVQPFACNVADKEISIAASCSFLELTQNVIRSLNGHSEPSLKISCKSVQPFSRNLADKETNKEINKEIRRRRSTEVTTDPRETTFLFQRLSVAVLRFNAACLADTFPIS